MNKTISVESDGIKFTGELLATREEFYFTLWTAVEIATGREFLELSEVCEAFDLALTDEKLAVLAAQEAGISMHDLCDMSHRFSRAEYIRQIS